MGIKQTVSLRQVVSYQRANEQFALQANATGKLKEPLNKYARRYASKTLVQSFLYLSLTRVNDKL
jgi:hypothetical protein